MPYRKSRPSYLDLLIMGLLLGGVPRGEASGGHHHPKAKVVATLKFRHSVYLREGRTPEVATVHTPHRPGKANPGDGNARTPQEPNLYAIGRPGTVKPAIPEHLSQEGSPLAPARDQIWVQPTSFTPYDRYLGTVRAVINHLEPRPATMSTACRLMKEGRRFNYVMGAPYTANPPAVTAAERAGDCKSKALWLYRGLGDSDALFVIGKVTRRSRTSHAWVYWHNENRWWILDCTIRSEPIAADSVSEDRYVPYYSYGRTGAFRHKTTCLINPGLPAVADHSSTGGK
jgi:hypothetical protein